MAGDQNDKIFGPEIEVDFTRGDDGPSVRDDLLPTFRIDIAVRRRF